MSKLLQKSVMVALCFIFGLGTAKAEGLDFRVNKGEKLYVPNWSQEFVDLAKSCNDLSGAECAVARNLLEEPRAYWLGLDVALDEEIRILHSILQKAQQQEQAAVVVLSRYRACGSSENTVKKVTVQNYRRWVIKIGTVFHNYDVPIIAIIEPGLLKDLVTNTNELCDGRDKKEVLEDWLDRLRTVIWNLDSRDPKDVPLAPKLRIIIDASSPSQVSQPEDRVAMAKALERLYGLARFHAISVNVGQYDSFEESITYGKDLIASMRSDQLRKHHTGITIAYDKGRAGNRVQGSCNARGAALDRQPSTLNPADSQIELVTIIKTPGLSDGDGPKCFGAGPFGELDLPTLLDYLHNTAVKYPPNGE